MTAERRTPDTDPADQTVSRVLDEYSGVLRNAVARVCRGFSDIQRDEIQQEARIRLWAALSRESSIRDIRRYLHRIVATAAIDAIRQVRSRRELPLEQSDREGARLWAGDAPDPAASPERVVEGRELAGLARQILAAMPANRRRAVNLHLQGFTSQEIADLLGWTEAKARNLASRGLRDVREELRRQTARRGRNVALAPKSPER